MAGAQRDGDPAEGLRYLLDRTAIADLVYTYALNIRDGNGPGCAELFAEDAIFGMYGMEIDGTRQLRKQIEGRDAIIEHISVSSGGAARVCPMIHNLVIRIDGNSAESACTMTGVVIPGGDDFIGEYRDEFRWEGRWRFVARNHTILLNRPPSAAGRQ